MKNLKVCSSLCLVLIVSLFAASYAWSQQYSTEQIRFPKCTLEQKPGRTIVHLGFPFLCSPDEPGACEGKSDIIYLSQAISSGVYDVTLESYDDHSNKPGQIQPSESYFLRLLKKDDAKIIDTNAIGDLPDEQDILTQKVNTDLYVGEDVAAVVAIHFCDESTGNNCAPGPNSIRPVCVAFDMPEPPGGGQGCTPGYWKQKHHFHSWAYGPETLFSAVFDNAFPGKTLLEVLGQGGGHLYALGRHAVAALLNAASPETSYDLTVDQVIDEFNYAFQGGDYEELKDYFEDLNEQGCPLN